MKEYTVYITFGASFDERSEAYTLLEKFHEFLEKNVPVDNYEIQDIKLGYNNYNQNTWRDK